MRTTAMDHFPSASDRGRVGTRPGALLVLALVTACAAKPPAAVAPPVAAPPRAQLRVGIAPVQPPLAFKKDGALGGVEVEFARRLEPALGVTVAFVEMAETDLLMALSDRRVDVVMSGLAITPERQQQVRFALPYLRVGEVLLLRKADARRLPTRAAIDRRNVRIGVLAGSASEGYVRSQLSRAQAKRFDTVDAAVQALQEGGIDVFVAKAPVIWGLSAPRHDPEHRLVARYRPLTEEYLAWAVRPADTELLGKLNGVLIGWEADGTLRDVLDDWIRIARAVPPR